MYKLQCTQVSSCPLREPLEDPRLQWNVISDADDDELENLPLEDQLFAGLRRKIENNIQRVKEFVQVIQFRRQIYLFLFLALFHYIFTFKLALKHIKNEAAQEAQSIWVAVYEHFNR